VKLAAKLLKSYYVWYIYTAIFFFPRKQIRKVKIKNQEIFIRTFNLQVAKMGCRQSLLRCQVLDALMLLTCHIRTWIKCTIGISHIAKFFHDRNPK
jgi:hypothetical protein